ncbi:MAG: hypothetical protein QM658_14105 [Gordonia sp. (in: high G+C Gram-positive bacteria)]
MTTDTDTVEPLAVVPPIVAAMFMRPEDLFRDTISMVPDDAEAMLNQINRIAELTGDDVDDILDETYVDMLGRVAISMVRTQVHALAIWASKNGRSDILMTYREAVKS